MLLAWTRRRVSQSIAGNTATSDRDVPRALRNQRTPRDGGHFAMREVLGLHPRGIMEVNRICPKNNSSVGPSPNRISGERVVRERLAMINALKGDDFWFRNRPITPRVIIREKVLFAPNPLQLIQSKRLTHTLIIRPEDTRQQSHLIIKIRANKGVIRRRLKGSGKVDNCLLQEGTEVIKLDTTYHKKASIYPYQNRAILQFIFQYNAKNQTLA